MISLIIPVYNEQDAVVDTVKRSSDAMTKTGDDFEIIVINDGSSDATQQ
ncbi:glycosyltransferase, partial [Patescibacteria group bacterium]|nr:glycosyltransferase [Patescibacteria group bacterium]